MADTYYGYRDTGVKIAHRLMQMNGWKVYGYHADNSDSMTDYWDPAYWNGTAEKNGYVFVFNCDSASKGESRTVTKTVVVDENREKIEKLRRMTQERGASAAEEETAKRKIEKLLAETKARREATEETVVYSVAHMANPPRCNWHIEKDGVVIDKGTGMLKFSRVLDISFEDGRKEWQDFNNKTRQEWIDKYARDIVWRWNYTEERAAEAAKSAYKDEQEKIKLLEQFNEFINRIDTVCGGLVGGGGYNYQKVKVTEYKVENKAVELKSGEVAEGGHFVITHDRFNHGVCRGYVYRFTDLYYDKDGNIVGFKAKRLDGKLRKVLEGSANKANEFYIGSDRYMKKFMDWVAKGYIHFCEIREVKTPYEVEKFVKVKKGEQPAPAKSERYAVEATKHTKTGADIWVVRLTETVDVEAFKAERVKMKELGGYYSKFVHGFVFDHDPSAEI